MTAKEVKVGDIIYLVYRGLMSIGEISEIIIPTTGGYRYNVVWSLRAHDYINPKYSFFLRFPYQQVTTFTGTLLLTENEERALKELQKQQEHLDDDSF